jgi:hypothetical protein
MLFYTLLMVWTTLWQMVHTRPGKGVPVVMGHSVHLCFHPLHQCLQWASSNCWHRWMPSCKSWQQSMSSRQDNRNLINNLKSPPTLTSWQHNLQSLLRRRIHLKLTIGFEWLSQSLDCFTALSFKRHCLQHSSFVGPQVLVGTLALPHCLRIIRFHGMNFAQPSMPIIYLRVCSAAS